MIRHVLALAALTALATGPASASARQPAAVSVADNVWEPKPYTELEHADWTRSAVLYQINIRQFTKGGTFAAAQRELPRLKALGVDILWLMPIHPIGEENRKGTLGSPYSVKDYYAVNPEFGTEGDLRSFIDAAHAQGFKVILDLVANHTAWDNALAKEHPNWYEKDWKGDFRPTPWWDWSDIIDLDWTKIGVRQHVGEAMEYWVREFDIDGYRADVAGYVPLDFWETSRARLNAIKPVFMLAEWKSSEMTRRAFDGVYAWEWHSTAKNIAQGKADATALYGYYAENESAWPAEAMRMPYIENHDSNAWEGTMQENFGPALEAFTALSFVGEGIPMIHNGQEACNAKRLAFFEKDPIDWSQGNDCAYGALLKDLIALRKANGALENGQWGARMQKVENDQPRQLFAWVRQEEGNKVLGLFNLSNRPVAAALTDALPAGDYTEFQTGAAVTVNADDTVTLPAWGFRILTSNSVTEIGK